MTLRIQHKRRTPGTAAAHFTYLWQAHVATIDILQHDFPLRFAEAPPFSPDSWQWTQPPGEPQRRDTAGEYVPIAFLRDGRPAIVTTIQDPQAQRFGFSWRTVAPPK